MWACNSKPNQTYLDPSIHTCMAVSATGYNSKNTLNVLVSTVWSIIETNNKKIPFVDSAKKINKAPSM